MMATKTQLPRSREGYVRRHARHLGLTLVKQYGADSYWLMHEEGNHGPMTLDEALAWVTDYGRRQAQESQDG
jgi:hypothetical protein